MNKLIAIFLLFAAMINCCETFAINASEDIDKTILNLYKELQFNQKMIDEELSLLQDTRERYWDRIGNLQKEVDKAVLVLYAQDGGSLFSIGLASEALNNICTTFNREKTPFQNWLQTMTTASNRHAYIRNALQRIHTEHLQPNTLKYIDLSISICDSLDARFTSLRDSIILDQQRYEKLSAEVEELESINSKVVNQIRSQLFQENDVDALTFLSTFNYSDLDLYYDYDPDRYEEEDKLGEDTIINKVNQWERYTFAFALIVSIALGIALRYILSKKKKYWSKRWYYAFLTYMAIMIVSTYIMSLALDLNSYMTHIQDVYCGSYLFIFWMMLSATIRLNRPGLGWSVAMYMPLYFLDFITIGFATGMTRNLTLKMAMLVLFVVATIWALITLIIGYKRILKADYVAVFSCLALIIISTILVLFGYYYISLIVVLYGVTVMTYLSALVCFKHFFAKRINKGGQILHLSLTHLIYPYFYIYVFIHSLNDVANVFNLSTWLDDQFTNPFVSLPEFGTISASRIIILILIGIFVNYIIKLIKLILLRVNKDKYETGSYAVAISLSTMLIWFGFGILALMVLQINHSGIIAAIGGASLGIGFAMKETFENLISGLQLMASRARPGDLIVCDGARGVIKHIGILSTQIEIEDGPIVSFPNRQLLSSTFTNLTLNHRREIRHIIFDISDDSDLELAKKLMIEASQDIDGVVDHEKHYVVMRNTNSGIVRLDYKCWIDSARYLRAEPAVREAIFRAFRANGIKIADFTNELGRHLNSTIV